MNKPSTVKNKVLKVLRHLKRSRDCDYVLQTRIWKMELSIIGRVDFLEAYEMKLLSSSESIRRCRQIIQEKNPELRGEKWYARHAYQSEVKQDLKQQF